MGRTSEIESMEAGVRVNLEPILAQFREAFEIAGELLRLLGSDEDHASANMPAWRRVRNLLLPRLADDLRGVWLLVERGYLMQAASLAASAVESGLAAIVIGRDEEAADEWLSWTDVERPPWKSVKKAASRAHQASDGLVDAYGWYQLLCTAKHANPTMQRVIRAAKSPAAHFLETNPTLTPRVVARAAIVLYIPLQTAVGVMLSMDGQRLNLPTDADVEAMERLISEQNRLLSEVVPILWEGGGVERLQDLDGEQ